MSNKQDPREDRIRAAIEARIDRLLALEELSWELQSFAEDLWGPVPRAWSDGVAELAAALSRGQPLADGETNGASWEAGRSQILAGLGPDERWLIGLSNHLWDHAFDNGRETIRRAAVESFLTATMAYIRDHPEVPRLYDKAVDEASVTKRGH
jgi:hypothetical protein